MTYQPTTPDEAAAMAQIAMDRLRQAERMLLHEQLTWMRAKVRWDGIVAKRRAEYLQACAAQRRVHATQHLQETRR